MPPGYGAGRVSRRRLLSLAAGAALAAGLAGTGVPTDAAAAELRVRIGSDIGVLDPATIFGIENQTVAGHIYNGLVKYDQATNEIRPDLATEWSVSDDGTAYTFKLRDGVTWHKGYGKLTSDDVKFSLEPGSRSGHQQPLPGPARGGGVRGRAGPAHRRRQPRIPQRGTSQQAHRVQPGLDRFAQGGDRDRRRGSTS